MQNLSANPDSQSVKNNFIPKDTELNQLLSELNYKDKSIENTFCKRKRQCGSMTIIKLTLP